MQMQPGPFGGHKMRLLYFALISTVVFFSMAPASDGLAQNLPVPQ